MDNTPTLSLPYILPNQAQKHVTHNEALKRLDALVQTSVEAEITQLPDDPTEGGCYLVGANAEGVLADHRRSIARFLDGAWAYFVARAGWMVWQKARQEFVVFDGADWQVFNQGSSATQVTNPDILGINTSADAQTRFQVKSDGSLFDAETDDHRVVVNKSRSGGTASVIFQDQYAGHAEIGLTGDNDLRCRISADGAQWEDALQIENQTGIARLHKGLQLGDAGSVLDAYDTGSWTPFLYGVTEGGTPVYSRSNGLYVRIGPLVFVTCELVWSSLGGALGHMRVGGLPFAIGPGNVNRAAITMSWYSGLNMDVGVTHLGGFGAPGRTHIRLWAADAPRFDTNNVLSETDLSDTGSMSFSTTYITSV